MAASVLVSKWLPVLATGWSNDACIRTIQAVAFNVTEILEEIHIFPNIC